MMGVHVIWFAYAIIMFQCSLCVQKNIELGSCSRMTTFRGRAVHSVLFVICQLESVILVISWLFCKVGLWFLLCHFPVIAYLNVYFSIPE